MTGGSRRHPSSAVAGALGRVGTPATTWTRFKVEAATGPIGRGPKLSCGLMCLLSGVALVAVALAGARAALIGIVSVTARPPAALG